MKYLYLLLFLLSGCAQSSDETNEIRNELLKTELLSKEQATFVPNVKKCTSHKGSVIEMQRKDIEKAFYNQLSNQVTLAIKLKNDKKIVLYFINGEDSSYDEYISNIYKDKTNLEPNFYSPLLKENYSEIFSYLGSINNKDKYIFSKLYQYGKFFGDPFSNIFIRNDGAFLIGEVNSYIHLNSKKMYIQYNKLNINPCANTLLPSTLYFLENIINKNSKVKISTIIEGFKKAKIDIEELSL